MRMTAEPEGLITRRYHILAGDAPITEISFPLFGPSTATPIAGSVYHLRRTGVLRDDFMLESAGGETVAQARQVSWLRHEFAIESGARRLTLRAAFPLRSEYLLAEGDRIVGSLRPAGPLWRRVEAELPDDLPVEARVFLLWVVLWLWRRDQRRRGAATSVGA
ncbi:MAG TPA: hypothetical protein VF812_03840 [Ktedonobacterales bacterium]